MKSNLHQLVYRSLLCGLLGSGGSLFAAPAADPPKKPEREDLFLETVNVSVVNVDVYVTDKKGEPVRGLSKDDFEIFENGKPVEVTNFFAVDGGKAVPQPGDEPAAPAAAPQGPPGAPRAEPPMPEDQRLRLIIYIDNFNLQPFNRNRVMRELRAFLGQHVGKGDQVMLVTFDRELHVRNPFTSDASLIANRLLELEKISAQGVHAASERREALQKIQDSQSVGEAESYARTYAQSQSNDAEFTLDGIKSVVNSMAGLPGRKALVYVSDGLQMMVGQDIYYAVHAKYSEKTSSLTEATQYDMSRRFRELTAQANANRVTFYTIDAAGLRSFSSTDASVQGPGPTSPGSAQLIDSMQIQNLQSSLQTLAEETGGQAILNSNSFTPGLEKMARDFGSYYSLGYTPPHFGDGRYYKIDVRLKKKNKDLRLRHREGYRDKSTESRMSDGTLAALKFAFEDNPLGVTVEFGPMQPRDDGFFLVPVIVRFPIGKLVLVPRETGSSDAKVRLFVSAIDSNENTSDVQQVAIPVSIPKDKIAEAVKQQYVYTVTLLMRGGDQRVAVGLRDDIAAQASFLSRGIRVGR